LSAGIVADLTGAYPACRSETDLSAGIVAEIPHIGALLNSDGLVKSPNLFFYAHKYLILQYFFVIFVCFVLFCGYNNLVYPVDLYPVKFTIVTAERI
jgi:hypothetical protein